MYEKALFPMPTLTITQGYDIGTHKGAYALDCAGEDRGIDKVYTPYKGIIRAIDKRNGNFVWLESVNPVEYADGTIDYMTMMFGHCNNVDHLYVGQVIDQWQVFYYEGTAGNATGNHVHIECGRGKYVGKWYQNSNGVWMIYNAVMPNEVLFLKAGTVIRDGGGLIWTYEQIYIGNPVGRDPSKDQIEVKVEKLRCRETPNGVVLGYINMGIYNILDRQEQDGYVWYQVEPDRWIAYQDDWETLYYKETFDDDCEKKYQDALTEIDNLKKQIAELEADQKNEDQPVLIFTCPKDGKWWMELRTGDQIFFMSSATNIVNDNV